MIHVVFNNADEKKLLEVIKIDETLAGEIVQIKDDYAVGPLVDIYLGDGIQNRKNWWLSVLADGDYEGTIEKNEVDDNKAAAILVGLLRRNENKTVWIWAAQNKHDVSGYYWLLYYLKEFVGRVHILYLNNLPFINEKGNIFYPNWLWQIQATEFLKAKKLARPITASEFELDIDEWAKFCKLPLGIRLLEGGKKLEQKEISFYDTELKKFITADYQKASKIIAQFLSKANNTTGDAYILWRLKEIIRDGNYEVQGKVGLMKDFEVKYIQTI